MVEIKKQTDLIALLFLLLLMLFSMLVFAQDNPLKKGVATDNNCTNFEHYSTQQVTAESGVNITLFLNNHCLKENRIEHHRLNSDARIMGVWHQYVVITQNDNGQRQLRLIDPLNSNTNKQLYYLEAPVFKESKITYFEPTESVATEETCQDQREEFNQWQSVNLSVLIAEEKSYTPKSQQLVKTEKIRCYPATF